MQEFGEKSEDLTGVFNSCWVFGRAKCCVYKPMWVDYKPYWGMWEDVILHRHNGQAGGWTAKWMLAFTKLACMIWGFSLLSQRIIIRTFLIYIGAHQASQVAKL